jgi:hypothetical protein
VPWKASSELIRTTPPRPRRAKRWPKCQAWAAVQVGHVDFVRQAGIEQRPRGTEPGRRHQQAEIEVGGGVDQVLGGREPGEVDRQHATLHPVHRAQLRGQGLERRFTASHEHQVQSFCSEMPGEGPADAVTGTGDQCPGAVALGEP